MRPDPRWIALGLAALASAGCVERRIYVTSEPTGARVWLNDVEVGVTPVEVDFTYFGVYDVRLRKDGFEPLLTTAEADAPFHEWPGVDLVALAIPVTKKTEVRWHFELEPADLDSDALLDRAVELREAEAALAPPEEPDADATAEDDQAGVEDPDEN